LRKNKKFNTELLKGNVGKGWNPMMRAMRRLQRKLKQSEIPVDKNAPRGKLVVADEEGFNTDKSSPSSTSSSKTSPTKPKAEEKPKIKLGEITDEDLLKMDISLDLQDVLEDETNLDDLLAEEEEEIEEKPAENVMSAIEAILDGGFDQVVMDKGKLQSLRMDDLKS